MIPTVEQAKEILKRHVKKEEFIIHNMEVGAAMKALGKYYDKDEDYWQVIGILHDVDIEVYGDKLDQHTLIGEKILQQENVSQEIIDIIKSHNGENVNKTRETKIEHCLYSADGLTGLVHAYVLMRPDKDIQQATIKSINKKLKDKAFAKGVDRESIRSAEQTLNIPIKDFIGIVLDGMKKFL